MSKSTVIFQPLAELADLPHGLIDRHRTFLNPFIGEKFIAHIGPRGKKSANARSWTRELFLTSFCDELYPNLSTEARDQYERILGPKIYSYLTNHSARGSTGVRTKPLTVKQRIYGHDVWRRENPELFAQALVQYQLDNPGVTFNIGRRRALTSDTFRQLPEDEQEKYRNMAKVELKTMQALHSLSGDSRTNYITRFKAQLEALLKESDSCAGIKINAQVLYEDAEGDFHIETFLTESMGDLEDAPEIDEVVRLLKDWIKAVAGKNVVKDGIPIATVYCDPNTERDSHPCIPAIIGLKVVEMQKVFRLYMTIVWVWQGGFDKVPWERISTNLDDWIPASRRPFGSPLGDPGELRLSVIVTWIEYIQMCQSGTIPPEKHIQYSQVIAGANPIDLSLSQESSRRLEFIAQQNRELWILEFSDTVTRCHAPGGMDYPKASVEYSNYLKRPQPPVMTTPKTGTTIPKTVTPQVDNLLDLPTGNAHPLALIVGQEKALLLKWADSVPDPYRTLIIELIDGINELQFHLPATTPFGIWVGQYANAMPTVFPSSPDAIVEGLQFFLGFWLPIGIYSPSAVADFRSRLQYFQFFVEDVFATPLIRHAPSGTLPGGSTGTVQLVRPLIMYLLNFAAAGGEFTPPHNLPSDEYDLTRLPLEELPNVLSWCRECIEAMRASVTILAQTSDARKAYTPEAEVATTQAVAAPVRLPSLAPAIDGPLQSLPGPSTVPGLRKPKQPRSKKSGKAKQTGTPRDLQSDEELGTGDSGDSSDEQDYEKLDPTSDDDDLDPDGFSIDSESTHRGHAEPTGSRIHRSIEHEDCTDGIGTPRGPLPRLPEECSEIFTRKASDSENIHHVFGSFFSLPPAPQHPSPASYEELLVGVNLTRTKVNETLREWNTLATINSTGFTQDLQAARNAVGQLPSPLQPLVRLVLTRRYAWEHAKAASTHVIEFLPRLALVARDALQLDADVAHFWESEAGGHTAGNPDLDALRKGHSRLLRGAIEVSWTYKELLEFEGLSTQWFRRLPSSWLEDDTLLSLNGASLYDLVVPLVDWANAARKLDDSLRMQRKTMWRPLNQPFEARCTGSLWYWFGNPRPDEIPEMLADSLKIIKEIIDNTDDDYVDLGARTNRSPPPATLVPIATPPPISSSEPGMSGSAILGAGKPSNDNTSSEGYTNKQLDEAPPAAASIEPTAPSRPNRSSAKSRSIPTSAGASVPARTTRSTANTNGDVSGNVLTRPRRSMRQDELGNGGSRTKRTRL